LGRPYGWTIENIDVALQGGNTMTTISRPYLLLAVFLSAVATLIVLAR
jgi:hypothetical protein